MRTSNANTKNQIKQFAFERGYEHRYSGKLRKHFFTRLTGMDIHKLINSK